MTPTSGTKVAMWLNIFTAVAGAAGYIGAIPGMPPAVSAAALILGGLNGVLHATTGNAPIVGGK